MPRHSKSVRKAFLRLVDVQKLIDNCASQELRFCLYCGVHAGMRLEETIMSRPEWFDLDARLVNITAGETWEPKDRENRTVPLTDEFADFLLGYGDPGQFMIGPHKLEKGKNRYRYDFTRRFENYVRAQGVRATYHDLKRTFASLRVSAGMSPYKIAKWLGNSIAMVELHYGHLIKMIASQCRRGPQKRPGARSRARGAKAPASKLGATSRFSLANADARSRQPSPAFRRWPEKDVPADDGPGPAAGLLEHAAGSA